MNDLKELLFKRTCNAWEDNSKEVSEYQFSALYALIIEAGLDNEFQEWKKEKEEEFEEVRESA